METMHFIDTYHQDIVHDISFDWYGNRVATCSSDRKVKIFYKLSKCRWKKIYEFVAHDAEVRKVKWAHPDFGSIIATCSYDKSVIIWEEPKLNLIVEEGVLIPKQNENSSWIYKIKLLDSKESIEDIKFAPKHLGLMLATASAEGIFRIYEAPDFLNLSSWRMLIDENVNSYGINSISWSKNPFEVPMLAIGCKDPCSSFQRTMVTSNSIKMTGSASSLKDNISFSAITNPYLCIYANMDNKWKLIRNLPEEKGKFSNIQHKSAVNDVSWASINGRSFELLVSGGKDGIIIWYLRFEEGNLNIIRAENLVYEEKNQQISIWKVGWNIMATVLASSDEKNVIRLWKNAGDKWKCVGIVKEEEDIEEKKEIGDMDFFSYKN